MLANKPHKEVDSKRQPALQREVQRQLAGGGVGATSVTLLGRRSRFGHRQSHLDFPGGFLISYALSPYEGQWKLVREGGEGSLLIHLDK